MSYCRWSTDDFRCDLYIYDDVRGRVTIHVAGRRRLIPDDAYPPPLPDGPFDADAYMQRHQAVMALMEDKRYPWQDFGLPHDGESFSGLDYAEAAAKVRELIALGYRCPADVADELQAEAGVPRPQETDQ